MTVAILLCTYFGEKHLSRQLESIGSQSYSDWHLFVSDDASGDNTRVIIEEFERRHPGRVSLFDGPRKGFAANFFSLISRLEVTGDQFAFCDQDDEWEQDKLSRAVAALHKIAQHKPAAYGSRSELIDQTGAHLGYSRLFAKGASFRNALVQNIVSGNTLVLNARAVSLLKNSANAQVSAHDWWAYLLVTGSGGEFIYDPKPTIRYRQHGENLYGENVSLKAKLRRISGLINGDFKRWNAQNLEALKHHSELLDDSGRRQLAMFEAARMGSPVGRIQGLLRSGVYRQTWDGNLALLVAATMNKL